MAEKSKNRERRTQEEGRREAPRDPIAYQGEQYRKAAISQRAAMQKAADDVSVGQALENAFLAEMAACVVAGMAREPRRRGPGRPKKGSEQIDKAYREACERGAVALTEGKVPEERDREYVAEALRVWACGLRLKQQRKRGHQAEVPAGAALLVATAERCNISRHKKHIELEGLWGFDESSIRRAAQKDRAEAEAFLNLIIRAGGRIVPPRRKP